MRVEVYFRYQDQPLVRDTVKTILEMDEFLDSLGIERVEKIVVTRVSVDPLEPVKKALGHICPD